VKLRFQVGWTDAGIKSERYRKKLLLHNFHSTIGFALLYSLIETAKANKLKPYAYPRYIFDRLPVASSLADYEALLP
jgi:hypothetical protein